jgi:hypothetical protein
MKLVARNQLAARAVERGTCGRAMALHRDPMNTNLLTIRRGIVLVLATAASVFAAPPEKSAVPPKVKLTWLDNSDNETHFVFLRKQLEPAGVDVEITIPSSDPAGKGLREHTDPDVVRGTKYNYRVRARNQAGDSADSNDVDVVVPATPQ